MPAARLGVFSDTHGNVDYLEKALDFFENFEIGGVCHLGDDYEDAGPVEKRHLELFRVPGIYSHLYVENLAPKKLQVKFAGRNLTLVHSREDLSEADHSRSDVILYGHTHKFEIRRVEKSLILNPGHLKAVSYKGREASFALLEIDERRIRATVFSLLRLTSLEELEVRL